MDHPILFQIGEYNFYTHGFFAVLGILAASVASYLFARKKYDCTYLFDNIVYSVLIGIIGARITYVILYYKEFSQPLEYLFVWQGGLVSYGGFFAGALALALMLKRQKEPVTNWFDIIAPASALGLAIGRFGEWVSGENLGVPTDRLDYFSPRVPISLYEAGLCLGIFVLLTLLRRFIKTKGALLHLTVILYTMGRFMIDFWRDSPQLIMNLSLSQIVSFLVFILFLVSFIIQIQPRKGNRHGTLKRFFRKTKKTAA